MNTQKIKGYKNPLSFKRMADIAKCVTIEEAKILDDRYTVSGTAKILNGAYDVLCQDPLFENKRINNDCIGLSCPNCPLDNIINLRKHIVVKEEVVKTKSTALDEMQVKVLGFITANNGEAKYYDIVNGTRIPGKQLGFVISVLLSDKKIKTMEHNGNKCYKAI